MKKLICYIMSIIMLLAFVSCGNAKADTTKPEKTSPTPEKGTLSNPSEMDNKYAFNTSSLQDFVEKLTDSDAQLHTLSQNSVLIQAANSKNLSFENYEVLSVFCTPGQNGKGELTGSVTFKVYFHEAECKTCSLGLCRKFYVELCYRPNGVDQVGILRGSEPTEDENIYVYRGMTISYTYLINDQYYCCYSLNTDLPDQKAVADQLKKFCQEIQSSLKNDTTVK